MEKFKILFITSGTEKWNPIGMVLTSNEDHDLNAIREDSPYEIIKISSIDGDRVLFKMINDKFIDDKIEGFWFRQTVDMLKTIDILIASQSIKK